MFPIQSRKVNWKKTLSVLNRFLSSGNWGKVACSALGSKEGPFSWRLSLLGFIKLLFKNHVSGEGMYLLVGNKTECIKYKYTCEALLAGLLSVLHSKRKYKSSWGASFCIQQGVFWPSHWCSDRWKQYCCHHNFISFFSSPFLIKSLIYWCQLLLMFWGQNHSMSVQFVPQKNKRTAPSAL